MKQFLRPSLLLFAFSAMPWPAIVAAQPVSEVRSIDAAIQKVDFASALTIKISQGPTPSLTLYGDQELLARVKTGQHGDTLQISSDIGPIRPGSLRAVLTLPQLQRFSSLSGPTSTGAADISGFSGTHFTLNMAGFGAVTMDNNYKDMTIISSATGPLTIRTGDSDNIALTMTGATNATLAGKCHHFTAQVGGFGGVDAKELIADQVDVDVSGIGDAIVYARQSATVLVRGNGSAFVFGNPVNRQEKVTGIGKAAWQ